jgi:hypothetical protein
VTRPAAHYSLLIYSCGAFRGVSEIVNVAETYDARAWLSLQRKDMENCEARFGGFRQY